MNDLRSSGSPLAGVTVLAFEQFGAGPWATLQLADLGARVIKVEDPATRGDVGRYVPPFQEGEDSLFFETFNRGKKSISLDLRSPAGREVLADLVRGVDVVFCNLRGDLPDRLGLTYEKLRAHNPSIVVCSLSGFGRTGPRAAEGAYDYVIQAMAGWMDLTGAPDSPPTRSGLSLVDFASGYVAALAILGGLWKARRDGEGCDCDIALFEVALSLLTYVGTWAASRDHAQKRTPNSAHPSIVPFQIFQTADGWIAIACAKEKFWQSLCRALDMEELLEDERFRDFAARNANRDAVEEALSPRLMSSVTAATVALLSEHGVPCGPVNDVAAALADPQVKARDGLIEYEHPRLGKVRQVASPLRVDGSSTGAFPAEERGESTTDVLTELCGYDSERIQGLESSGAFGGEQRA